MKLFSDKFWEKNKKILFEKSGDIIGLNKTKVIHYNLMPFVFKDVRKVFDHTPEEIAELLNYYTEFWNLGTTEWQKIAYVVKAVNNRLTYMSDKLNWNANEYWARPIETHRKKIDDCDGYANLSTLVLRLLGIPANRVFTAVGKVNMPNGVGYHAYTIVLDITKSKGFRFFPLEGSMYPSTCMKNFLNKSIDLRENTVYHAPDWITNDEVSFSNTKWFKLIK